VNCNGPELYTTPTKGWAKYVVPWLTNEQEKDEKEKEKQNGKAIKKKKTKPQKPLEVLVASIPTSSPPSQLIEGNPTQIRAVQPTFSFAIMSLSSAGTLVLVILWWRRNWLLGRGKEQL